MGLWKAIFGAKDRTHTRHVDGPRVPMSEFDERVEATAYKIDSRGSFRAFRHAFLTELAHAMDRGETVVFRGFGTFSCRRRNARRKTLPSGKKVDVLTRDYPHLLFSDRLKKWMQRPGPEEDNR